MRFFMASVCLLIQALGGFAQEKTEPKKVTAKSIYKKLVKLKLDGRAIALNGLTLQRDVHTFQFDSGHMFFFEPVAEKTVMGVFVGNGSYTLTPANEDECRVLGQIHGEKDLKTWKKSFGDAVFMFTDGTFEELSKAGEIVTQVNPQADKAVEYFRKQEDKAFRTSFEKRLTRAMVNGGAESTGLFLAFPHVKKLDPFIVAVDPLGPDGIDFGGAMRSGERSYLYSSDERNGGYWYAHTLKDSPGSAIAPRYVDALDYEVETEITGFENIKGTTKMRFKVTSPNLQALPVFLTGNLGVSEVSLQDESGNLLGVSCYQRYDTIFFFEEPLKEGSIYTLTSSYEGRKVLYDVGNGNYFVVYRTRWYPNMGVFGDRANYKLIFKTPKSEKLVATGKLVKETVEKGKRISEWESDEPITIAGFNYGKFLQYDQDEPTSGMALSVHHQELVNENIIHNNMADAINSIRLYNNYFGKLPYSTLAMTQQTQAGYGQAWPSLVFLPYISFLTGTQRQSLNREANDLIDHAMGPHEVAHQWFGHQISGATYRDQWLEEGFAQFAAGLLIQNTMGWKESNKFWNYQHRDITAKVRGSKLHYYEVAPLHMGFRMATQEAPRAYSTLVYSKGGYVVHMLRMMMMDTRNKQDPDAKFRAMMKDYFKTHKGQNVTTADFQKIVEKHMTRNMNATGNGSMDWFFKQWVYGMALPKFESEFTIKKEGDKFRVKGSISQKDVPEDFLVMMPVYADFGKGHLVRFASIPFKGSMTQPADWLIPFPKKPKRIVINAYHDVLTLNGGK